MPMTLLQEKARKKYISVKEFAQQYGMCRAQAYRILAMPEFEEAVIKIGTAGKKVDIDKAFDIMQKVFR